jgi:hypothetical protein
MRKLYTRFMTQFHKRVVRPMKSSLPAKPRKAAKLRKNVMLTESAIALGKTLAVAEHRNFSNLLEMLLVREAARLGVV